MKVTKFRMLNGNYFNEPDNGDEKTFWSETKPEHAQTIAEVILDLENGVLWVKGKKGGVALVPVSQAIIQLVPEEGES